MYFHFLFLVFFSVKLLFSFFIPTTLYFPGVTDEGNEAKDDKLTRVKISISTNENTVNIVDQNKNVNKRNSKLQEKVNVMNEGQKPKTINKKEILKKASRRRRKAKKNDVYIIINPKEKNKSNNNRNSKKIEDNNDSTNPRRSRNMVDKATRKVCCLSWIDS